MTGPQPREDGLWQRARAIFAPVAGDVPACDVALLGVPGHLTSLSPTRADATPAAVRDALRRYSTWSTAHGVDVATLTACDLGDVPAPDGPDGETRVAQAVGRAREAGLLIALGGDNSITYAVARERVRDLSTAGLITVDIHHDLRDGASNGSPVRRLIEAGLPGDRVAQIGIADFSNSPAYAQRARDLGITVVPLQDVLEGDLGSIVTGALDVAGSGGGAIHVDIDVDVCDRSVAPACPASAPGGLSAAQLRRLAFLLARDPRVTSLDITEIDATADAPDGRTVRLAALLVLEAMAGYRTRTVPE